MQLEGYLSSFGVCCVAFLLLPLLEPNQEGQGKAKDGDNERLWIE